jgi:aldehyde dehydrogenase (NAD+)
VEAARRAFKSWRLVPAPRRAEVIFRLGELLRQRKRALAEEMTRDMGKVIAEAEGDVQEGIDMAYFAAGEGRRMYGQTTPVELPDKFGMSIREPIGVIAAITPWNFPVAIPSWKLFPALVLGNTAVFKPATDTPLLGVRMAELAAEAGLPAGVLNLVTGPGGDVGEALVTHPDVALVSFTGSTETGKHIARLAADTLKRVTLELGGKNGVIVMDDADLDLAVEAILWGAFGTSGQRCTATSRVIAHQAIAEELGARLVSRAQRMRLGDGLEPSTDMGPVINEGALRKIDGYVKIGRDEGAELLTGGSVARDGELARGFFYQPTIFAEVKPSMRIAQEEIFGPVLAIEPVGSLDEAIAVANDTRYGLSLSCFTRDVNSAFRAIRDLESGIVYINHGTTGAEIHLPFGGIKATGNGHREAGAAMLDAYSEWKAVYVDYSGRLQRAQIDTEKLTSTPPPEG